jgi:hypothetical protein
MCIWRIPRYIELRSHAQTYAASLPPSAASQASFILHPCKLLPRTSYYCTCNLLVHGPSSHLPEPGSLCLSSEWISTAHDVWISWLTLIHSTFAVAKHPNMLKLHFSPVSLMFDHAKFVSKTVPIVYLTSPVDRDSSVHHYVIQRLAVLF